MKLILIIILIVVVMLIAYATTEQYKDKFDFYNNLKTFLEEFKINLSFRQDKIIEFLNKVNARKQFKLFIDSYKEYLQNNKLDLSRITILESEEMSELEDIILNIGKYDVKNELGQLESFISHIEIKVNQSLDKKNKLCPMILKLSFLFAVGIAILLI